MSDTELALSPAHEQARRVRRKQVSAVELLDVMVRRLDRLDADINAVPVRDLDRARDRAREADAALARGQLWGPLHGVPITVKESFDVAGLPTTCGFTAQAGNIATTDAVAVQRYKAAGAVLMGKTNVPVSLADWQSFNPVYGTTNNPWHLGRTPGGSSGGSAAALAAGLSALELGTDIGASIRNPAHFCGVWGHKPTWSVVPLTGHGVVRRPDPDHYDLAVAGPLARSAADLQLAMDLLASPLQAWSPLGRLPMAWRDSGQAARQMRVAMLYDDAQAPVDDSVQALLHDLAGWLRSEGVSVTEGDRPVDSAEANQVYLHLLRAATGSRYDDATWARTKAVADTVLPDAMDYRSIHHRASTFSHRDWALMDARRAALTRQWDAYFERYDLLICPVATTAAFPHMQTGERWERMLRVNGQDQPSTTPLYWAGYPLISGLPATAVPVGLSPEGLPIGAQLIGPRFSDPQLLRFARWLEDGYRGFVPPPMALLG